MKKLVSALSLAAVLSPFSTGHAATITFSDSTALQATKWTDSLVFGKFDTNFGTLTSIQFDLNGLVQGIGNAESLDGAASNVTLSLSSLLSLTRPDNTTLLITNPVFSQNFAFSAFDGRIDFGGTSGGSTGTVSNSSSNFFVSTSTNDFALFSALGGGNIRLGLFANGASSGTGAGNLITQILTSAAGNVSVTYNYTPTAEVPEPASIALILGGLGLIGAARRRKSKRA